MGIKIQKKSIITGYKTTFCFAVALLMSWIFSVKPLEAQPVLNGLLKNYLAAQTTGENEFIAARNRLRFNFEKSTDIGGFNAEIDLIHTFKNTQELNFLLKEAYFDWYLNNYDLRVGHQKIIWGRSNGAFITDIVTPVDLREFLTISAEDIRFGVTSFNAVRYFGSNSLQLVVAPFFQPNLLPSSDSRWFPAGQITSLLSPIPVRTTHQDDAYSIDDIQMTLRYSLFSPEKTDLDLFLMRWTHPTPAYDISIDLFNPQTFSSINLVESYKNSWMAGVSSSVKISSEFFFLMESLYVFEKYFTSSPISLGLSPQFLTGAPGLNSFLQSVEIDNNFLSTKPWIHAMAGFRTEFLKTQIEAQFFIERILDYEDNILNRETYRYVTLLGARSFLRDRLQILLLSRYNIDTEDFWIQLEGQYELDENLQLSLGTNLFGGKKEDELTTDFSFAQYRENSFIFSKIALFF